MILWNRVKKSFDDGVEIVTRVAKRLSERARIEAAVARLLIDKGTLETKADRLRQRLGERVYEMWEERNPGVLKDTEVVETIREINELNEQMAVLQSDIKRVSMGEEEA